ncbi:HAD family hydrolase [Syntrophus aciditrophicus]|uniref:phosphoglycolate phosphatase n=1 Tax=Syntrophus aciditrophicus (strain SB) TaxID=56780 RepID=Q2LSP7_SYNAS|nr:HAD-IA family hydrolase [Syntrophus aciditrophicus]ABC77104.1 hydrolase, haloacid dehalogenase-like family [Syntrophus aciditrophicus SB]
MIRKFKAFVFDFDGTLAELNLDFTFMKESLIVLSRQYGIDGEDLNDLLILELIETVRNRIFRDDPTKASDFYNTAHFRIRAIELEAARRGALLSGTLLLLTTLKKRGNAIGIITRNCRAALKNVFPQIEDYCDVLLSRDQTIHVKPHPDHLIRTLSILGASPEQTVMVGDHPLDIQLGREVGTYTIGVLTGHTRAEALFASGADLVLNRAVEILDLPM